MTLLGPGPSVYDQLEIVPGGHGNRSPNNAPRNTCGLPGGRCRDRNEDVYAEGLGIDPGRLAELRAEGVI